MATHNDAMIDTAKVILANIGAISLGFIQLDRIRDDVEWGLKILSLLIAIGYTIWKWRNDIKRSQNKKK